MIDKLCGQSGVITAIVDTQNIIKQLAGGGAREAAAIRAAIGTFKNNVRNLTDKKILKQRLQAELFAIIAQARSNPDAALGRLESLKAAYRGGGASVDNAIRKVRAFIRDPLNNPLDICNDIDNVVKYGNEVYKIANPAKTPDINPQRDVLESFDIKESLSKFDPVPRYDTSNISQMKGAAEGYVSRRKNARIGPGSANQAALSASRGN